MYEDPLSPHQIAVFGAVMTISSVLSLFSSMLIINMILVNKKLGASMFYRIMLGICILEILTVLKVVATPIMLPRETGLTLALGNFVSCDVIAFWSAIHMTFFLFNLYMSCYYLMVAHEMERAFTILEVPAYVFAVLFPVGVAIATVLTQSGAPHPLSRTCFYGRWPVGCSQTKTEPSCVSPWDRECEAQQCTRSGQAAEELIILFYVTIGLSVVMGIVVTFMIYGKYLQRKREALREDCVVLRRTTKRLKNIATQAIYYCLAYTNTAVWLFSFLAFDTTQTTPMTGGQYTLLLLIYVLLPIQGFFNAMIFIRPRWRKWRKATRIENPSVWFLFHKVWFTTEKPPRSSSDRDPSTKTILKQSINIASKGDHDSEERQVDYESKVNAVLNEGEDDSH